MVKYHRCFCQFSFSRLLFKFSIKWSDSKLPFVHIFVPKAREIIWMNIYSKLTDLTRYFPYLSNDPKPCLKNMPFCLAKTHLYYNEKQKSYLHEV